MRLLSVIVLSVLLLFLGSQVYTFLGRENKISREFSDLKSQLDQVTADKNKLQAELDYLSIPTNLEKELRARFNYRAPGEKMVILVPATSTATSTGH